QIHDGYRPVELDPPAAVEGVREHAQICTWITSQIAHLVRGAPAADLRPALLIDAHGHRAELRRAVGAPGAQYRMVLFAQDCPRLIKVHVSNFARRGTMGASTYSKGRATCRDWDAEPRWPRCGRR